MLDAVGYIFGVEEGGYAVIDAGAQLVQGQRGIGDKGIWKRGSRVHCEKRANMDIRRGRLRLRKQDEKSRVDDWSYGECDAVSDHMMAMCLRSLHAETRTGGGSLPSLIDNG
jgi:hypothetical protein